MDTRSVAGDEQGEPHDELDALFDSIPLATCPVCLKEIREGDDVALGGRLHLQCEGYVD